VLPLDMSGLNHHVLPLDVSRLRQVLPLDVSRLHQVLPLHVSRLHQVLPQDAGLPQLVLSINVSGIQKACATPLSVCLQQLALPLHVPVYGRLSAPGCVCLS
jgi:hypothetical protein